METLKVKDFSLKRTLESGQFFHFKKIGDWYYIHNINNIFKIRQEDDELIFKGTDKNQVLNFFGLNNDFENIKKELMKDEFLRNAVEAESRIRIINQDPWQCTMSFICSSFSNIKKIRHNINKLSSEFGDEITFDDYTGYSFPKPGKIDNLEKVKKCAIGYRAKYLFEANKILNNGFFEELRSYGYEKSKEKIMEVPGVGEKVADCALLFSLDKTEAFPVDVWIARVMKENFKECESLSEKKIAEFGRQKWGKLAGYAQQYLYHWRRMKK